MLERRVHRRDGFQVALMRARQERPSDFVRRTSAHNLFVNLSSRSINMEARIEGGPARLGPLAGQAWTLVPAGVTLRGVICQTQPFDHVSIAIETSALDCLADTLESRPNKLLLVPRLGYIDQVVHQTAQKLCAALRTDGALGHLYSAQLCDLIATELLIGHSAQAVAAVRPRGGLAPAALRRVLAYLNSCRSIEPDPTEAIALSGVSRGHFFRAFKQSTGLTPERYLMTRRIEYAQALIAANPSVSPAQVALEAGLGSTRRLRAAFQRVLGASLFSYYQDVGDGGGVRNDAGVASDPQSRAD